MKNMYKEIMRNKFSFVEDDNSTSFLIKVSNANFKSMKCETVVKLTAVISDNELLMEIYIETFTEFFIYEVKVKKEDIENNKLSNHLQSIINTNKLKTYFMADDGSLIEKLFSLDSDTKNIISKFISKAPTSPVDIILNSLPLGFLLPHSSKSNFSFICRVSDDDYSKLFQSKDNKCTLSIEANKMFLKINLSIYNKTLGTFSLMKNELNNSNIFNDLLHMCELNDIKFIIISEGSYFKDAMSFTKPFNIKGKDTILRFLNFDEQILLKN